MQSSMGMFTFFFYGRKYPFWENLVLKIKIVSLRSNLISILIRICRIQWWCSLFFRFQPEVLFLGKFGPKIQNCQFKMKLDTSTNSNIHNSMVMITFFFVFDRTYSFWANLVQKLKIVSLKWNLITGLIRICRIRWCCSLFRFRPEILFLGKFGPKS